MDPGWIYYKENLKLDLNLDLNLVASPDHYKY